MSSLEFTFKVEMIKKSILHISKVLAHTLKQYLFIIHLVPNKIHCDNSLDFSHFFKERESIKLDLY